MRVLDAGARVFAARGSEVGLNDVVRAAVVGVGTVYRKVADKDAMLDALAGQKVDALVAAARQAATIEDPGTAVRDASAALLRGVHLGGRSSRMRVPHGLQTDWTMDVQNSSPLTSPTHGLLATPGARLPYQHDVLVRSFVLERPRGNVIVYNSPGVSEFADAIRELGGASRLLVNHAHESMYGSPELDVPLYIHDP